MDSVATRTRTMISSARRPGEPPHAAQDPGQSTIACPHPLENSMSTIPADLKYTASHEWVRVEADGTITVGITDHAQNLLGDMVFIELPEAGSEFTTGDDCVCR